MSRDTTYEYDNFDRLIETTDAAGNVWEWTFSDNGNVLTETYNGKTTAYAYDALGRLVLTTDADDRETHFEYGNDGRLKRVIDGEENATEYLYDALGRLVLTIAADGGKTEQRYDAASNLVALIDPVGNTTTWQYDRRYQVVSETDPLGEASFAIYDEVGRAASTTDRLGRTKVYTWSDAGRLLSEEWYDAEDTLVETLTYTYYEDGRLWTATNSAGTYTYTYDDLGRVATIEDPNGITLTYGWNEVDNLVALSDSEGGLVESVYDEADRLIERSQSGTGVESLSIQIGYDEEGRRGELRRYSDTTGTTLISSTEYGYDDARNLTSLIHKDGVGDPLVTYVNTFDENSRITSETRNSVTVNYEYDATSQVINDDTNEYEYDLNGNRTMDGYTTGAGNRIESDGTWTYEYDLEGNLVKKSMGEEAETWEYGYDHNNRLLWVEKADTDGGIVRLRVEFAYDVFGNRIAQQVGTFDLLGDPVDSDTTKYAFVGSRMWAELDNAGDITIRYLLGVGITEVFARSESSDVYWLLQDRLGSVREVLDAAGEIVAEINYDSAGNQTSNSNPSLAGNLLWQGMYFLTATGLYITDWRVYDPSIARWYQTDPADADINTYRGMGNNGANLTDPSGLDPYPTGQGTRPNPNNTNTQKPNSLPPFVPSPKPQLNGNPIPLHQALRDAANSGVRLVPSAQNEQDAREQAIFELSAQTQRRNELVCFWGPVMVTTGEAFVMFAGRPGANKLLQNPASLAQIPAGKYVACFPKDTVVGTEHGARPIQDVRAADRVWAFDLITGVWKLCRVVETYSHEHDGDMVAATVAGEVIESTGHHPWWVVRGDGLDRRPQPEHVPDNPTAYRGEGRWVDAIDLRVGDVLLLRSGEQTPISSLAVRHAKIPVYNFHVEDLHCYAVGEAQILVHNNSYQLRKSLTANVRAGEPGEQAAHIVPAGDWSWTNRSDAVKAAIRNSQAKVNELLPGGMNGFKNGFWAKGGNSHFGTHKDAYFLKMEELLQDANTEKEVVKQLNELRRLAESGAFK